MMVRVTEFPVDTLEEEMYCDHLRDYLTVMFWHPAVDGFLMWGFCASATAIHPRALLCLVLHAHRAVAIPMKGIS